MILHKSSVIDKMKNKKILNCRHNRKIQYTHFVERDTIDTSEIQIQANFPGLVQTLQYKCHLCLFTYNGVQHDLAI
jgi:hypothetical protein